ncbi:MAG: hypothetical protein JEZ09_17365 [Salinivirgaceae bacterium]|nr:hypothetical protein [Salinivirgaceae bacterium]
MINLSMNKNDLSGQFGPNDIRRIQLGLSIEQLETLLGKPYYIKSLHGLHRHDCQNPNPMLYASIDPQTDIRITVNEFFGDTNYCCSGNKREKEIKCVSLFYTKPVKFSKSYPMFWVNLDSNFRVNSVFVRKYDGLLGFKGPYVYSLTSENLEEKKELFNSLFD